MVRVCRDRGGVCGDFLAEALGRYFPDGKGARGGAADHDRSRGSRRGAIQLVDGLRGRRLLTLEPLAAVSAWCRTRSRLPARELRHIAVAPAPPRQLGEQVGKLATRPRARSARARSRRSHCRCRRDRCRRPPGHARYDRPPAPGWPGAAGGRRPRPRAPRAAPPCRLTAGAAPVPRAIAAVDQAATSGDTNAGTKVTITTPPFFGQPAPGSSRERSADDRPAPGPRSGRRSPAPRATSRAALIVAGETCERSTSIPSRFISRTTSRPNWVSPPCRAQSSAASAQSRVTLWVSVMYRAPRS